MDKTFFDQLPERRSTESAKWRKFDEDILPMWVADMDFRSPEPVIQALRARVEHGVFGYPHEMAELRQVVVAWLAARYGWQVKEEDVVFNPGVIPGFNLACHALAKAGEGLVIQPPVYRPILEANTHAGLLRQDAELVKGPDGTYEIDFEAFEAAFTGQSRLFLLCNPHNPVGRVFRKAELERMAEICLRKGVWICSDEIHADLIYNANQHNPIASLDPAIAQKTITLISPSKTFNLAGIQCSFAIIPNRELRDIYCQSRMGLVSWVNLFGQVAALAAYREGQAWLDELLIYLEANRDYLTRFTNEELPGVRMVAPEGTYLAWMDCRESGIEGNPGRYFREKARVALDDGETFGPGGQGFVRLNFGCPRAMLEEALERMKGAILNR